MPIISLSLTLLFTHVEQLELYHETKLQQNSIKKRTYEYRAAQHVKAWIESKKTYSDIAIIWVQMGGTFSLDITIECFFLVCFHGWRRKWHEKKKKVEGESDSCLS
jgi:hypothetical protein